LHDEVGYLKWTFYFSWTTISYDPNVHARFQAMYHCENWGLLMKQHIQQILNLVFIYEEIAAIINYSNWRIKNLHLQQKFPNLPHELSDALYFIEIE
jgi:hypothetical protein